MKYVTFLFVIILLASCTTGGSTSTAASCHLNGALPDSSCTPGVTNPDVTQDTINQTICVPGWTKTVRPPVQYTDNLKVQQIGQYGYSDTSTQDYEEDHLIPLELGGNPQDPGNLWPEPRKSIASPGAEDKDKIEYYLNRQVCSGRMSLADARVGIANDWTQYLSAIQLSTESIPADDPDHEQ